MSQAEIEYLMELVRRDGDESLQSIHGIRRHSTYDRLGRILDDCRKANRDMYFPVFPTLVVVQE